MVRMGARAGRKAVRLPRFWTRPDAGETFGILVADDPWATRVGLPSLGALRRKSWVRSGAAVWSLDLCPP